jgi:hypothetical protein
LSSGTLSLVNAPIFANDALGGAGGGAGIGGTGGKGGNGGLGGMGGDGGPGVIGGDGGNGANGGPGGMGGYGGPGGTGGNGGGGHGGLVYVASGSATITQSGTSLTNGSVQGGAAGLGAGPGPAGMGGPGGAAGAAGTGGTGSPLGSPGTPGSAGANGSSGLTNATGPAGSAGPASFPLTNLASTTTAVTSTANPSIFGPALTFTATVTNTTGVGGTPTGSVEFFDGATDLGPGSALTGGGASATSTLTIATLSVGSHSIEAVYTATGPFLGGTGTLSQTVNSAPLMLTAPSFRALSGVANAFTHSPEYYQNIVTAVYQKYLGRAPDSGGLAFWINALEHGLSDERLEAGFIGSPEFIQDNGGLGAGWITSLYQKLLGRAPDAMGVNYWLHALQDGASPSAIALGFAASPEREAQRISADYQTFFGRPSEPAGTSYWVNAFENGTSNEDLVADLVSSPEYFQKHGANYDDWLVSVYQDVLGRAPGTAEFQGWLGVLNKG